MVRDRRKYAFNPPKIRFRPNTKLPTSTTNKSEKTVGHKKKTPPRLKPSHRQDVA
jgi:hypothetical protein